MANAIYPKYKEALISGSANISLSSGTVKVALVDTAVYTYSAAHEFLTSLTGTVGTAPALGSKTVTNGVFDAADPTWTAVSGSTAEALVAYIDTGVAGTSRLVAYIDTGITNLPVTPNGGDIVLAINASGLFAL
jgi:hypothetical protein